MGLGIAIWIASTLGVIMLTFLCIRGTYKLRNNDGNFLTYPWLQSIFILLLLALDLFLIALSAWMIYGVFVLFGAAHDIFR